MALSTDTISVIHFVVERIEMVFYFLGKSADFVSESIHSFYLLVP